MTTTDITLIGNGSNSTVTVNDYSYDHTGIVSVSIKQDVGNPPDVVICHADGTVTHVLCNELRIVGDSRGVVTTNKRIQGHLDHQTAIKQRGGGA